MTNPSQVGSSWASIRREATVEMAALTAYWLNPRKPDADPAACGTPFIDPAKAYATNRFNQLNATMDLDMAMSRLAKATGWDAIAPDGT